MNQPVKNRCPVGQNFGDKRVQCDLPRGHDGDHESDGHRWKRRGDLR